MAISKPPKDITKSIGYFKGLKISINNTQIDDENSPDMLNLLADDRGALDKRPGRINILPSLGTGKINGVFAAGTKIIVSQGGKLYEFNKEEF